MLDCFKTFICVTLWSKISGAALCCVPVNQRKAWQGVYIWIMFISIYPFQPLPYRMHQTTESVRHLGCRPVTTPLANGRKIQFFRVHTTIDNLRATNHSTASSPTVKALCKLKPRVLLCQQYGREKGYTGRFESCLCRHYFKKLFSLDSYNERTISNAVYNEWMK